MKILRSTLNVERSEWDVGHWTFCVAFLLLLAGPSFAAEPAVDAKQLPRVAPTEPAKALATFKIKPGFHLELAAAEPLVVSPVAMSFDEAGRLYVVEMRDYSERRPERLGRIRLLEDVDGDGRFEKSTVFAEGLPWPTAVICWAGGVFVGTTPDILYFKDADGDGKADVSEPIFTGFASDYAPFATNKLNVQALMNSFNWSLDNRIHGATSFSGGKVKLVDTPFTRQWLEKAGAYPQTAFRNAQLLDLRGRDFSYDPRTLEIRPENGGGQHGMSFDNRGRKFVCSNSDHIQVILYEDRETARHPYFFMPSPRVSIAADGPAAEVFRRSPEEPWRVLRTQWRVSGLVPGPIEGGGRSSGYFTGATGVTIYRGDTFGDEFVDDAFIGDAGSNLVHRKKLRRDGLLVLAERPADEQKVEFLASTDNWFRPVQFANAPDGCLYIADMYREVIEHPWSLPATLKQHLDLNSGNDRGRIYRIVPEKFQRRPPPSLGNLGSATLVDYVGHPNGWQRDTAARLLYERQDRSILPSLATILSTNSEASNPIKTHLRWVGTQMRIRSLYLLDSMGALRSSHVVDALRWRDFALSEHALKVSERFLEKPSGDLWEQLVALTGLTKPETRPVSLQLAFTLGHLSHPERLEFARRFLSGELASDVPRTERDAKTNVLTFRPELEVARNRELEWIMPAVMSSSQHDVVSLFERLVRDRLGALLMPPSPTRQTWALAEMARFIGTRNNSNEVNRILEIVGEMPVTGDPTWPERAPTIPDDVRVWTVIVALEDGLRQAGGRLRQFGEFQKLQPALRNAANLALTERNHLQTRRLLAIRALSLCDDSYVRSSLLQITASNFEAPEISRAALSVLAGQDYAEFGPDILKHWPQLGPSVRNDVLNLLLRRPERILALLGAVEDGTMPAAELTVAQQAQLRSHRDRAIRDRAERVLGRAALNTRQSVVETFQPALALGGNAASGRMIFQARCATCHKLGNEGHALGPDLVTVKSGGKEKLLIGILDPNREVAPNFASYTIETKDGESLTGVLTSERAGSVTLGMAEGKELIISRANIVSLQSQGRSLMPEGLEEGLKPQDLADLMEFILTR